MKIEIDQSGKIADTHLPTVLTFSNGISYSIYISAETKRQIIISLRKTHKASVFYMQLFALLIFILLRKFLPKIQSIHIDQEYKGREDQIKRYFLHTCLKHTKRIDSQCIHFVHIGKHSRAHMIAITALQIHKANREVSYEEIMKYFISKKKDRSPYSR